jgi:hypothetical protein
VITPEDYVKMMQRRLDSIQSTAGEALREIQVHGWSKNLGKKDRDAIAKVRRDLSHIIRYASIMKIGGDK